jgi:pentatricopeptide repeat protein
MTHKFQQTRMNRRRKQHRLLYLCLLLAQGFSLQSSTPWRRIHRHSVPVTVDIGMGQHPSCLKASSSSVTAGSRQPNFRELEQEIVRLGRSGRTDDALTVYYAIERPTVRLMNGAIDSCARAHSTQLEKAFGILEDGVHRLKLEPNVFTFGALMSACARARRADRALALLVIMKVRRRNNDSRFFFHYVIFVLISVSDFIET